MLLGPLFGGDEGRGVANLWLFWTLVMWQDQAVGYPA